MEIGKAYQVKVLKDISVEVYVDGDYEAVDYIDKKAGDIWEVEVWEAQEGQVKFYEKPETVDELCLITDWVDTDALEVVAVQKISWEKV